MTNRLLYWTPRVLSILFILFVSLFALDVFGQYQGWDLLKALFIHLIPTYILIAATVIAWRYEFTGAVIFLGLALWYIWMVGFDKPLSWYIAISGPAALVGVLYFIHWLRREYQKS